MLQVLTSQLLFHKPNDPKQFIIDTLTTIQVSPSGFPVSCRAALTHVLTCAPLQTDGTLQNQGAKPLLDDVDIDTMFSMFDVTQQGVLTKKQAFKAVETVLGPKHVVVTALSSDAGDEGTMLNKEGFKAYVSSALKEATPQLAT